MAPTQLSVFRPAEGQLDSRSPLSNARSAASWTQPLAEAGPAPRRSVYYNVEPGSYNWAKLALAWFGRFELFQRAYALHRGIESPERLEVKAGRVHGRQDAAELECEEVGRCREGVRAMGRSEEGRSIALATRTL